MPIALAAWCSFIGKKWLALAAWLAVNGALFYREYCFYGSDPAFFYVHQILGRWLCVSRGAATLLNLNCCLLLLPVCRALLTLLRAANTHVSMGTVRVLLDAGKTAHMACAAMMCGATALHVLGHLINVQNFSSRYNAALPAVNGAAFLGQNPLAIICFSVPGVTGLLMVVILFLVATASTSSMRSANYDVFWWVHRLVYVFMALMLVHAFRGPIRRQVNVEYHTPGCRYGNASHGNQTEEGQQPQQPLAEPESAVPELPPHLVAGCTQEPQFDFVGCRSWMWMAPGVLLYLADVMYRWLRQTHLVTVISHTQLPGHVHEVRMRITDFSAVPGQYVLLQCPAVSTWEWHPYSVSQCPDSGRGDFSVHIKTRGDWSQKFTRHIQQELVCRPRDKSSSSSSSSRGRRPLVRVDGPYSGPLVSLLTSRVALCVAGGIGVTPFASVLPCLGRPGKRLGKLRRLYLVWINRHLENVHWFLSLLHSTHLQLWEQNRPDLLQVQFFLTGDPSTSSTSSTSTSSTSTSSTSTSTSRLSPRGADCEAGLVDVACTQTSASLTSTAGEGGEQWRWMQSRLTRGRPDWSAIFQELAAAHPRTRVQVLACGPRELGQELRGLCLQQHGHSASFSFHHETF